MISFLASIIVGIGNFFSNFTKSYDSFFDLSEEYLSKNIKNGKVFYDLGEIEKQVFGLIKDSIVHRYKSSSTQGLIYKIINLFKVFISIPIVNKFYAVLRDMHTVYKDFSKYLLSVLILGVFPVVVAAIYLFIVKPELFFFIFNTAYYCCPLS